MKTYMYILFALVVTNIALGVAHAEEQEPINLERTSSNPEFNLTTIQTMGAAVISVSPVSGFRSLKSFIGFGDGLIDKVAQTFSWLMAPDVRTPLLEELVSQLTKDRYLLKNYKLDELFDHLDKAASKEEESDIQSQIWRTADRIDHLNVIITDLKTQISDRKSVVSMTLNKIECSTNCVTSGTKEIK